MIHPNTTAVTNKMLALTTAAVTHHLKYVVRIENLVSQLVNSAAHFTIKIAMENVFPMKKHAAQSDKMCVHTMDLAKNQRNVVTEFQDLLGAHTLTFVRRIAAH